MTTVPNKRALAPLGDAPIQRVDTTALQNAIIAALPGGSRMTTDQANGLAVAAQISDRNPFAREIYMIPGVGAMDASSSKLSDFNEWLEAHGDKGEWTYLDVTQEVRDQFNLEKRDVILEVRLHLKSAAQAWREKGEALHSWGVPWQEIIKECGKQPPFYSTYGIVRFSEQKDDPRDARNPRTAEQKWAEMDAKYSRIERARKRGRTALIAAVCPVTTEQRRRVKEVTEARIRAVLPVMDHDRRARALGRTDMESLIDQPEVVKPLEPEPQEHQTVEAIIETDSRPADDVVDTVEEETAPEPEPVEVADEPLKLSPELETLKSNVDTLAVHYQEQQRTITEKQVNFLFIVLKEACGKNDDKRKMFTLYLTGREHFPDVPHHYLLAIKDQVLKPRQGQDGYNHPDPAATKIVDRIYNEMRIALGQQPLM